jgi:hypothetical protein
MREGACNTVLHYSHTRIPCIHAYSYYLHTRITCILVLLAYSYYLHTRITCIHAPSRILELLAYTHLELLLRAGALALSVLHLLCSKSDSDIAML